MKYVISRLADSLYVLAKGNEARTSHVTLFNKPHTCARSANRRRRICANAIEEARRTLMPQAAVVFSISDNFCLVLHWSSLHFTARSVFPFYPQRSFVASPFCLSPSLASILRRLSRHCPRFFAAVPVETMRARFHNIEQSFISGFEGRMRAERESKTWDNYSMLPEQHHAGWILPVWLLKIIGSSHREECSHCRLFLHVYATVYACVRAWNEKRRHDRVTAAHLYIDSCTWRLWISTWGENTEGILGLHGRRGLFAVLIYINIRS